MEFKEGDKVKYLGTKYGKTGEEWESYFGKYGIKKGSIGVISVYEDSENIFVEDDGRPTNSGCLYECDLELFNEGILDSKSLHKTMEKKIFNVLVVNKKTGAVDKRKVVVAENEQSAILKAFGVDVENVFIKITEEGSYTEEKPVNAIIVKEPKKAE